LYTFWFYTIGFIIKLEQLPSLLRRGFNELYTALYITLTILNRCVEDAQAKKAQNLCGGERQLPVKTENLKSNENIRIFF
jgi:hypothetical protein